MARALNPQDCYALINLVNKELSGENATIQAIDPSSFISAGELALAAGTENVLNALSTVLGRTLVKARPYEGKLLIVRTMNNGEYANRIRKISYYSKEAEASGDYNTQLYTNLYAGYDNGSNGGASTASMWEQNPPVPLEVNFGGSSVWEYSLTLYEDQLKYAFRDEASFGMFVAGILTEAANDMEQEKEAFDRAAILNAIAGCIDLTASMPGTVVNLTTAYNAYYSTSYTAADLRTTYLNSFLKFFVATFKEISDRMEARTVNYHWTPTRAGYVLKRHTPKSAQKAILYGPLFTHATAEVMPEIFSPQYLGDITQNGALVQYWQNANEGSKISVTPAIPDVNGTTQIAGAAVTQDYVVGILFDEDAIVTDYQFEAATTTPLEARKRYRNQFWHTRKNAIVDFTENMVVFVM